MIVTDIDTDRGQGIAANIGGTFARLNVASEADWTAIGELFPPTDVLVNDAGITGFEGALAAHDPESAWLADWQAVQAVNPDGTYLGCRYAIQAMRAKGSGSTVNISSRSRLVGIPTAAACASTKAAVCNPSRHTKPV